MKSKSLKKNALLSGFQKLFSIIFPLITFPYITRILRVDTIGQINFAKSIISYFVLLSALGINNYAIREGSRIKDDKEKINTFCSEMFSINILSTLVSYIFLGFLLLIWGGSSKYLAFLLIESITIIGTTIGVNWLYSIFEEYKYIAIRTIIFQLISLVALLLFVRNSNDGIIYVLVTVLSAIGSNVFNYFHSKKFVKLKFTLRLNFKRHIKPIMIIFASAIAVSIYVNSDVTILGWIKDDHTVGLYSVSVRIYTIIKQLVASMVVVTLPRVSEYLGNKDFIKYKETINEIFNFVFAFTLPIGIGMACVSKDIIYLISGTKYLNATNSLIILSISIIFSVFSSFVTYAVILPNKYDSGQLIATIVSAITNIALNIIIIPWLSLNGAALTTVLAELIVFVIEMVYYKKHNKNNLLKNMFFIDKLTLFSTILGSLIIVFISFIIPNNVYLIHLILTVFISAICYTIICVIFKNKGLKFIKK